MTFFIKLSVVDRKIIFEKTKEELSCNCNVLAKELGVSRDMFFKYRRGDYLIPECIFKHLIKLSSFQPNNFEKVEIEKYNKKIVRKPTLDCEFAEILGALNGDGHLSKINHEISIIGNLNERDYIQHLQKKFEDLFKIKFKVETYLRYLKLRAYSVDLVNFLNKIYGLPKGKKKGNLLIPKQILSHKNLIVSYFRGLFDTDGTFYIRRKKDPVIEISSADKRYLEEIKNTLKLVGFEFGIRKNNIHLYKKEEIKRFFEIIRPANPKHLKKYNLYLNNAPVI